MAACKPRGFKALTSDDLQAKIRNEMKPEKSLAGDESRQAAVIILCWTVGRGKSKTGGWGVFLGRRVGECQRPRPTRGLAAKARLGLAV